MGHKVIKAVKQYSVREIQGRECSLIPSANIIHTATELNAANLVRVS